MNENKKKKRIGRSNKINKLSLRRWLSGQHMDVKFWKTVVELPPVVKELKNFSYHRMV